MAVLACLVAPAGAFAARATPTPSAKELWQTYPLYASPDPSRAATVSQRSTATPKPRVAKSDKGSSLDVELLVVGAALLAAGGLLWVRHRRRTQPAEAATVSSPRGLAPPEPSDRWTAEITWDDRSGGAKFRVIAEHEGDAPVTLAESEPVPWPPGDPEAIRAVSAGVDSLSAQLEAVGWLQLPSGRAWYARRFAWEPAAEPSHVNTRRFHRGPDWPAEATGMWRCEIVWDAGPRRSRFKAVVLRRGTHRSHTIATSQAFKAGPMATPDGRAPEQAAEVRRLADGLRAAGWQPVAPGREWYSARFMRPVDAPAAKAKQSQPTTMTEAP